MRVIEHGIRLGYQIWVPLSGEPIYHCMDSGMARRAQGDEVSKRVVCATGLFSKAVDMVNHRGRMFPALLASVFIPSKSEFSVSAETAVRVRSLSPSLDLFGVVGVVRSGCFFSLCLLARFASLLCSVGENKRSAARFALPIRAKWDNTPGQSKRLEASFIVLFVSKRLAGWAVNLCASCRFVFHSALDARLWKYPASGRSLLFHGTDSAPLGIPGASDKMNPTVNAVRFPILFHVGNLKQNVSHHTTLRGLYV